MLYQILTNVQRTGTTVNTSVTTELVTLPVAVDQVSHEQLTHTAVMVSLGII